MYIYICIYIWNMATSQQPGTHNTAQICCDYTAP